MLCIKQICKEFLSILLLSLIIAVLSTHPSTPNLLHFLKLDIFIKELLFIEINP